MSAFFFQPFEFVIIIGGALGAFVCANSMHVVKTTLSQATGTLKPPNTVKIFTLSYCCFFMHSPTKHVKRVYLSLEDIIDNPESSPSSPPEFSPTTI